MSIIQRLPIGFTEVECLSSTGQQNNTTTNNAAWLDIGVVPSTNIKVECKCQFTTLISGSSSEALFGTTFGTYGRFAWGFASLSPYTNFYVGLGNQNLTTSVTRDTNPHVFIIDATNQTWKIDNTSGTFSSFSQLSTTITIGLFGRHNSTSTTQVNKPSNANVYYCKVWDNGVLIRNMIPCYRNSDSTYGMYDLANDVFYTNNGAKAFSIGSALQAEKMRLLYKTDSNGAKLVIPVFPQTANTKPMKLVYFPK